MSEKPEASTASTSEVVEVWHSKVRYGFGLASSLVLVGCSVLATLDDRSNRIWSIPGGLLFLAAAYAYARGLRSGPLLRISSAGLLCSRPSIELSWDEISSIYLRYAASWPVKVHQLVVTPSEDTYVERGRWPNRVLVKGKIWIGLQWVRPDAAEVAKAVEASRGLAIGYRDDRIVK